LSDGLFSNQKSKFGKILEGLEMQDVGIFYGHLVHFTVFCYILLTFGIVCGNLVYFYRFGILYQEKSGNPAREHQIGQIDKRICSYCTPALSYILFRFNVQTWDRCYDFLNIFAKQFGK
jgi:hypothetical protein